VTHSATPRDEASLAEVFRQAAHVVRRHLWLMLLLGLVAAAGMLALTQTMERLFKSSVQLMIDPVAPSPIEAETTPFPSADTGYVDAQILLIEADDTLLQVVERGNLTELPFFQAHPPNIALRMMSQVKAMILGPAVGDRRLPEGGPTREELVAKNILADALSVEREGDTNVITISVRANSPRLSQRIATLVGETFVDIRLSARQRDAMAFRDWIGTRAEDLRLQVSEAEKAVTAYRIRNGLLNDQQGVSLSDQQLTEVNTALIKSRADLAQKAAALQQARSTLDSGGDVLSLPEVQLSGIVTELRNQILLLELSEQDLTRGVDQISPRLAQVRQQLASLQRQLDVEVNRIITTLANEVQTLESRAALLQEALTQVGGQSNDEARIAVELRQLEQVAEALRQRYQRYLDNVGMAAELNSYTTSGVQVVTSATVPIEPYYPTVKVFVLLSFITGSVIGVVIGLARDALDPTFRSAQQVEDVLQTPVRAQIPKLKSGVAIPDVVSKDPTSPFSETISDLRYMLLLAGSTDGRAPVILMTSNAAGEGKTSIASSLALSASLAGKNVLLIDADLRRAGLTRKLGFDDDDGFADVLRGGSWEPPDHMVQGTLDILPAGRLVDQPWNVLESPDLPRFLEVVRRAYDLIVMDGPPVANIVDCTILAQHSDQFLFVVRSGVTRREQALRGFRRLPKDKVSGVVMNGCSPDADIGLGSTYKLYSRAVRRREQPINLKVLRPLELPPDDRPEQRRA
jgi:polysaccharide biosynthesis transport protein